MSAPFIDFRAAARALIASDAPLSEREGQFCGGMAYRLNPATEKQLRWLGIILNKHGLPPIAEGGAQ